jgi:S-formylglutathione hydrolase FrmB
MPPRTFLLSRRRAPLHAMSVALAAAVLAGACATSQRAAPPPAAGVSGTADRPAARGRTATDSFWSQSLGIRKRFMVWLPPTYATRPERRYPVAYFLHGAFGDETNWTTLGRLDATLDSLTAAGLPEMIVVMPDGDDGWYTTWNFLGDYAGCRRARAAGGREPASTYCVPWPKYDDYIARDLVAYVDRTYRSKPDRRHRGLAGLSMGGYGAVTLALSYPDVFSAAASHSGVLAPMLGMLRPGSREPPDVSQMDSIRARWGELWPAIAPAFGTDTMAWWARDPARRAARLLADRPSLAPALRIDCGTEDHFIAQSRAFSGRLAALRWPVDYHEYPGGHTWEYWRRHSAGSAEWLARRLSGL